MGAFKYTELEDGEEMLFGPITSTRTTSFGGGTGPGQSVSKTSGHTLGVTNRRVIVEDIASPNKTRIVPNEDVQLVFIKRGQRRGQPTIDLSKVETASGQTIKLNIKGLPAHAEDGLQNTFPNAEIALDKGMGCPLAATIPVGLLLLAGILFVVIPLLLGG